MVWTQLQLTVLPLVVATILGGLLGLERELAGRWAGLRTHMLVALGSALFVISGITITESAPAELSRIIQGVATGVGFIGAGTILKLSDKGRISGLTTASSVWASAGIGVTTGAQMYLLSVTATAIALFILKVLDRAEEKVIGNDERKEE